MKDKSNGGEPRSLALGDLAQQELHLVRTRRNQARASLPRASAAPQVPSAAPQGVYFGVGRV